MSIQNKRKESLYFRAVSEIITNKVTNANISETTVTDAKLSNDGSILTVYVTFENNKEKSLNALIRTKGFIRTELAKTGSQRIVPNIVFKYDKTVDSARRIDEILAALKNDK